MKKKIVSLILSMALLTVMTVPVFAEDNQTKTQDDTGSTTCEVTAVVDSAYTVSLPATLNLQREENEDLFKGTLSWGCKGLIPNNKYVQIYTDSGEMQLTSDAASEYFKTITLKNHILYDNTEQIESYDETRMGWADSYGGEAGGLLIGRSCYANSTTIADTSLSSAKEAVENAKFVTISADDFNLQSKDVIAAGASTNYLGYKYTGTLEIKFGVASLV